MFTDTPYAVGRGGASLESRRQNGAQNVYSGSPNVLFPEDSDVLFTHPEQQGLYGKVQTFGACCCVVVGSIIMSTKSKKV